MVKDVVHRSSKQLDHKSQNFMRKTTKVDELIKYHIKQIKNIVCNTLNEAKWTGNFVIKLQLNFEIFSCFSLTFKWYFLLLLLLKNQFSTYFGNNTSRYHWNKMFYFSHLILTLFVCFIRVILKIEVQITLNPGVSLFSSCNFYYCLLHDSPYYFEKQFSFVREMHELFSLLFLDEALCHFCVLWKQNHRLHWCIIILF